MDAAPNPATYEKGLQYWPYKDSLARVIDIITTDAPHGGSMLDMMCGHGYLAGQIAERRADLSLHGVDLDEANIAYAKGKYQTPEFEVGDILTWQADQQYDVVACTGALHHLPYERQKDGIQRIASMVKPGGFAIISDAHIDDYTTDEERIRAAGMLGTEYLLATIENGAPNYVITDTIGILVDDVLGNEFKTSLEKRLPVLQTYFGQVEVLKVWPDNKSGGFGDYIMVCKNPKFV